jgi:hypothetical protein
MAMMPVLEMSRRLTNLARLVVRSLFFAVGTPPSRWQVALGPVKHPMHRQPSRSWFFVAKTILRHNIDDDVYLYCILGFFMLLIPCLNRCIRLHTHVYLFTPLVTRLHLDIHWTFRYIPESPAFIHTLCSLLAHIHGRQSNICICPLITNHQSSSVCYSAPTPPIQNILQSSKSLRCHP